MGIIRPATPGFLVTLAATAILAVVSFCVPYFKSVYFLRATISVAGNSGNITFGTLGYCLELSNGTTCSSPTVGYELDINSLVGNELPVEIPQVAVKWLTTALVLHIVALGGAALAAVFGLLAHVREASMACCSTFVSGFAAVVAMFAFIFDLVFFFVAKSRINSVGSAQIGNAVWLTLAAWLLLFFSGCFYTIGRCCISSRPRAPTSGQGNKWFNRDAETGNKGYEDQMRLDAVKAEADRKARQKQNASEQGLPAFYESQPLTGHVDGDQVYLDNDDSHARVASAAGTVSGHKQGHSGYVQGASGARAIDEYYAGPQTPTSTSTGYPPRREPSEYSRSTHSAIAPRTPVPQHSLPPQAAGGYGASSPYDYHNSATPPINALAVPSQYAQDPYSSQQAYGHTTGGSSYHTAAGPYDHQPYDPYAAPSLAQPQPQHYAEPSYNDPYNNAAAYASPQPNPYLSSTSPPLPQQSRAYTLGGDGYGSSSVPPLHDNNAHSGYGYNQPVLTQSPPPINTNVGYSGSPIRSPIGGPRPQPGAASAQEDLPPGYEPGTSGVTGKWGK